MNDHGTVYEPFDRDSWRDPYPLYRHLRERDPVHRSPSGFWVLSRFEDVFAATIDPSTYSSAHGLTFTDETARVEMAPTVVMLDPPDHTRYRRLVNRGFAPRQVSAFEGETRRYTRELVTALREEGTTDFVSSLARRVPNWVVARYLGVPEEDRGLFEPWTEAIVQGQVSGFEEFGDALADLYRYFTDLVRWRRSHPADDVVSDLLRADEGGRGIGLEGILGYAFVLIAGGNDTTTGLLAGAADLLTVHRDQRLRLLGEPTLLGGAIDELLRLVSPVQGLCRMTTRDTVVRGTPIDAGDRVLLCYGAANRDRDEFGAAAEDLDVGRTIHRMLSFGGGPHFCMGAAPARMMGRVVVEELLAACPDFVADGAAGVFAGGAMTRRYESLPFSAVG